MPIRPTVFIGSSSEGKRIAGAILVDLEYDCDVKSWLTMFAPSEFVLEALLEKATACDFAVLVLTPDDLVNSRGSSAHAPRDNVLLELGLCLGAIGLDRTFIVTERSLALKLPSDLAGVNTVQFNMHIDGDELASVVSATTQIRRRIESLGRRNKREEFALCIPRDALDSDEFNRELKYHLMERLLKEEMTMEDRSSLICPFPSEKTVSAFRTSIRSLEKDQQGHKVHPKYMLIIWPGIVKDGQQGSVLSSLKSLVDGGCRIAAFNEFPEGARKDFHGKLCLVHANAKKGFELLCEEVQRYLTPAYPRVLLVHASQEFQSARRRRELYHTYLGSLPHDEIPTDSWDYEESRAKVFKRLTELGHHAWPYGLIAAANDNMAMGAADALDEYSEVMCLKDDEVVKTKVIGYDGLPSAIRRIEKEGNRLVATLAASPLAIVETAFDALLGHREPDENGEFPVLPVTLKTTTSLKEERLRAAAVRPR